MADVLPFGDWFNDADTDRNGLLSPNELLEAAHQGMEGEELAFFTKHGEYVFWLADLDGNYGISFDEMMAMYECRFGQPMALWMFWWADWSDSGYNWLESAVVAAHWACEFDFSDEEEYIFDLSMGIYSGAEGWTDFDGFWNAMPCE